MEERLANWGNFPVVDAEVRSFSGAGDIAPEVAKSGRTIVRGMGRSYGDASLGPHVLSCLKLNKILAFDPAQGIVTCQAGVTLAELLEVFVPRGWFLPVTPGTKFITVGGAIAADVHGKNHHRDGCFSRHVHRILLARGDGEVVACSPQSDNDLFEMTCGGMGLTGAILEATFSLRPIESVYVRQEILKAENLDEIMRHFDASQDWTYTVAWIDCLARGENLGRSLLMRGEHATRDELDTPPQRAAPLTLARRRMLGIPFMMPGFLLNRHTVRAFNALYYWKNSRSTDPHLTDYDSFFYPLDFVNQWNRIYGAKGFTQYQVVIPLDKSREGLQKILERIGEKGWGSFLAVLKLFGRHEEKPMSFPMEGYTLALDFPVCDGLLLFLDELDELVVGYGGRVYMAKDARMSRDAFARGYPNAEIFKNFVRDRDPQLPFRSRQSDRLGITE
jgi:FAD/FMN-containing dehydrogenase